VKNFNKISFIVSNSFSEIAPEIIYLPFSNNIKIIFGFNFSNSFNLNAIAFS
jgi:hypothetical protein